MEENKTSSSMKKITIDDFKKSVAENGITRWNVHNCSMCNYTCGFIFNEGNVFYDSGCDCVIYKMTYALASWEQVLDYYNSQTDPTYINEIHKFFRF